MRDSVRLSLVASWTTPDDLRVAARMEWEREEARRLRRTHGMKLRAIAVRRTAFAASA
jgi:hypothetical protein